MGVTVLICVHTDLYEINLDMCSRQTSSCPIRGHK